MGNNQNVHHQGNKQTMVYSYKWNKISKKKELTTNKCKKRWIFSWVTKALHKKSMYCAISFMWGSRTGKTNLRFKKIRITLVPGVEMEIEWEEVSGTLQGNGNTVYLVKGLGYTGICICQSTLIGTLNDLCILVIVNSTWKKELSTNTEL